MGNYYIRGIGMTTSGDISIGANGDLELSNSYETKKAAINFLLKTDKGQYRPDPRIGCDLGTFIGSQNFSETFTAMEKSARANIVKFILDPTDVQVHVMPLDQNNAGIFLIVGGDFSDENGNALTDARPEVLTYVYPFTDGQPTLINIHST
jgi:hypothetical protein